MMRNAALPGRERPSKRVLMVAYHFPPLAGSSGIQRTLRFVQHLPSFGWQPLVLTADPRAYERTSDDLQDEVPAGTVVERAFALDAARHLSIGGRYWAPLARPDRWMSWRFDAVRRGLAMVRRFRPDVIWSTYPIATAHLIGSELARRTGLPWVADFRDPMAQDGYPADAATWSSFDAIERTTVARAALCTFTTPGAVKLYRARYPQQAARIHGLENGYDEDTFAAAEAEPAARGDPDRGALAPGAITLLHSGIVYPSERDPSHLLDAVRGLHDAGRVTPKRLRLRFRAAVHDESIRRLASERGVLDYIDLLPPIAYSQALAEMLRADGLLVMQASNCNEQVPAKIYEYMRARRPIVALTDSKGDTAEVLRQVGVTRIAALDDAPQIASLLEALLAGEVSEFIAERSQVDLASRWNRSAGLASLLEQSVGAPAPGPRDDAAVSARALAA